MAARFGTLSHDYRATSGADEHAEWARQGHTAYATDMDLLNKLDTICTGVECRFRRGAYSALSSPLALLLLEMPPFPARYSTSSTPSSPR